MTDDDLRLDVAAELSWDPRVDSQAIAVSADDGAVTLRGTVGSFREKREVGKAAARVYGVTEISNELRVRVLDGSKRDDAEVRGDVLQALMLDRLVPMTVNAKVRGGFVALTGTADWQYQRDEAEFLTASVPGVFGIKNDITLTSTPDGRDIKNDISNAFRRNARHREPLVRMKGAISAPRLPGDPGPGTVCRRLATVAPQLAPPHSTRPELRPQVVATGWFRG